MLQGKRIVAFVVGGVTRSEMRVAHKLSAKLGREILIGSTSCDTPTTFLKSLQVAPPSFCVQTSICASCWSAMQRACDAGHSTFLCVQT